MANPVRNIRISDDVWFKAKEDALRHRMTLQDWITLCILRSNFDDADEKHESVEVK